MKYLNHYKSLIILTIVYFLSRLPNLTLLPIFNDEGIYLDWGYREISVPGNLFYSLYDAKQPLLMWLFGISMHLFTDPLFAGRLVGLIMGLVTLLGIYKVGKEYFSHFSGVVASLLYISIPLFSFFDRQALMESAIGAVGIWSIYYCLQIVNKPEVVKFQVLMGIILGIGLLIKTNALLFFLAFICIVILSIYNKLLTVKKGLVALSRSGLTMIVTSSLLLIQPQFWSTLSSNSRYSLTISELLHFPLLHFFSNMFINTQIIFATLTPFVVIIGCYGMGLLISRKKEGITFVIWFGVLLFLQTLLIRESSQRYIVSILPIFTLFTAYGLSNILTHTKKISPIIITLLFFLPVFISFIQIVSPITYFSLLERFTKYSEKGAYVSSANSGYGIPELINDLENKAKNKELYVATAINTGNPESALRAYFARNESIATVYLDSQMFEKKLYDFNCLETDREFYFVSREEQQAGLNKFLMPVKHIKNPYGENTIGIYTLRKPCSGKKLPINMKAIIEYEK